MFIPGYYIYINILKLLRVTNKMKSFWQAIQTGEKGTENFRAFIKRNCDVCDIIAEKHKGKNVLVVTHAANARVVNYYFTGKPKDYDWNKEVVQKSKLLTLEN